MTMTDTAPHAPDLRAKQYNMKLLDATYIADAKSPTNNGRYSKDDILRVDEETAIRWFENGIAEIAPANAPTKAEIRRQVKREEFLKRAQPTEGVFDQMVTRQSFDAAPPHDRQVMPPPMPVPPVRRGRPARALPDLGSANIATADTGDEE